MPFGRKPTRKEKRRQRERFFEMLQEDYRESQESGTWHLMSGFVLDEGHQLFRTPDGRAVMSRHFVDTDLRLCQNLETCAAEIRTYLKGSTVLTGDVFEA